MGGFLVCLNVKRLVNLSGCISVLIENMHACYPLYLRFFVRKSLFIYVTIFLSCIRSVRKELKSLMDLLISNLCSGELVDVSDLITNND